MILLANGCSNTQGMGIQPRNIIYERSHSWPAYLAKLMNIHYINLGLGGSSNTKIIRRTLKYIIENPNNYYVILGMTEITRIDLSDKNYHRLSDESEHNKIQSYQYYTLIKDKKNNFAMKIFNNTYNLSYFNEKNLQELKLFQSYLKLNNIPYLFFNVVKGLNEPLTGKHEPGINLTEFNTINESFCEYANRHNFKRTPCNHFYSDAHESYANVLYKHINNK